MISIATTKIDLRRKNRNGYATAARSAQRNGRAIGSIVQKIFFYTIVDF